MAVPLSFIVASILMLPLAFIVISLEDESVMPPLSIVISFLFSSVSLICFPSSLICTVFLLGVEIVITFFSSSNSIRIFSRVTMALVLFFASYS